MDNVVAFHGMDEKVVQQGIKLEIVVPADVMPGLRRWAREIESQAGGQTMTDAIAAGAAVACFVDTIERINVSVGEGKGVGVMEIFGAECIERDADADSGVRIEDIGRAIMIWVVMQQARQCSVCEAAIVFNTTPEIIREAVEADAWADWVGVEDDPVRQFIEVDGA